MKIEELKLFKVAKELQNYVMIVTTNAPKKYRHTIIDRLNNHCDEVVLQLYMANELLLIPENAHERRNHQNRAVALLYSIGNLAELAMKRECIKMKQYNKIAELSTKTLNYLGGWKKSDASQLKKLINK